MIFSGVNTGRPFASPFDDTLSGYEYCTQTKPRMLCKGNGAIFHLQTEWDLLRDSITACTIDENTFSAPFGILYVRKEI